MVNPEVSAPSPTTHTTLCDCFRCSRASTNPTAAETPVPAWPALNVSYSLSLALAETAQPAVLPNGVKLLPTSGQQFVGVRLVARIPDDEIPGRVQQVVKGDGQFDDAEVGGEMAADVGNDRDDLLADFLADLRELFRRQILEIGWPADHFEDGHDDSSPLTRLT